MAAGDLPMLSLASGSELAGAIPGEESRCSLGLASGIVATGVGDYEVKVAGSMQIAGGDGDRRVADGIAGRGGETAVTATKPHIEGSGFGAG